MVAENLINFNPWKVHKVWAWQKNVAEHGWAKQICSLLTPVTEISTPAPHGLWILEEEQENNLAECRDVLCKGRYQIWHTKRQLPGWKGQRSALFKWRCSSRKAELNLFHLRGEKSKVGTDVFSPFYPYSFPAGTMMKCKPSSSPAPQHSETKQGPAA